MSPSVLTQDRERNAAQKQQRADRGEDDDQTKVMTGVWLFYPKAA